MTRERANFAARVIGWQRAHGRHDLPWQTRDPYRVWLSEVMLQQTQVATALPYFERFVASFPDVYTLAVAPLERVLEHWSGLGYYRRAHHLHAAARLVVERHGGEFPRNCEALAELPGIGRSTAAAIAAFAFGVNAAILDGNVKRVLARHRGVEGFTGLPAVERKLWQIAESLRPSEGIEAYTQGMMDLGAMLCTRTNPRCTVCPVADDCIARCEQRIDALPTPRPAKIVPQRATRLLLIERAGEWLLERRPPTGVWSGLWSFPEIAMDIDVSDAITKRFGNVTSHEALAPVVHAFTHFTLTMHPVRVEIARPRGSIGGRHYLWLTSSDAIGAALPSPIRRLLKTLSAPLLS